MNIKFIAQGLDPLAGTSAGQFISEALASTRYNSFKAFVAFVSISGLNNILDELRAFKAAGHSIKIFLGIDLFATSKEALEKLLELDIETYVVYSPNNVIFHPKIYTFEGATEIKAIIGSSNLTARGLYQNIEASVSVDFNNDDEQGMEFIASVYEHFNTILDVSHASCKKLTADLLQLLLNNKVVLSEEVNRIKNNKVKKEFSKRDPAEMAKLLAEFGKIVPKMPPKGFKRTARAEVYDIVTENEVTVAPSEVIIQPGAMWAETKALTGGSRNILDLSMTGTFPATGASIVGSISFFEINEANRDVETDITIEHGGKIYLGNTIKFPTGENSNESWRLQLKGVTEDGEKLTTISKPELGRPGGFVNKILLFTKVTPTYYKMDIIAPEEMDRLIATSSVWGKNGLRNTSKAYGFIQA